MAFLTPNATGERDVLVTFINQQFAQARSSVYGLSDKQIHERPSVSAFTPALLVHHLADVADGWGAAIKHAPATPPAAEVDAITTGGHFTLDASVGLTALLTEFDRAVADLNTVLATADLDVIVPTPQAPWFPPELAGWQVRWVMAHLIGEVARHAGHADIVRESIDGKGSYELNARADGELADDEEFPTWG